MNELNERQEELLKQLGEHKYLSVSALSKMLFTSEATVRRDLLKLDQMHLLSRTHGGARVLTNPNDLPLALFNKNANDEKRIIGIQAARMVHENNVVFLDATSTSEHVLEHIRNIEGVTVFTNGLETAQISSNYGINTYCVGGKVRSISSCCYGSFTEKILSEVYFDVLLFSAPGLAEDGEITHYSLDFIPFLRSVFPQAKRRYLLCLGTKLGLIYNYRLCNCSELTGVISDKKLPPSINQIHVS